MVSYLEDKNILNKGYQVTVSNLKLYLVKTQQDHAIFCNVQFYLMNSTNCKLLHKYGDTYLISDSRLVKVWKCLLLLIFRSPDKNQGSNFRARRPGFFTKSYTSLANDPSALEQVCLWFKLIQNPRKYLNTGLRFTKLYCHGFFY